jgi:glyoxylase-like metal-dependent hydrolase (beta-lactamase superfamily II)
MREVAPGLYEVALGYVNAFIVAEEEGLTVIDTGRADSVAKIVEAIGEVGRQPADVGHILVTHAHFDHAGGLAELKRLTGGTAVMHPADAILVGSGRALRPAFGRVAPGMLNKLFARLFLKNPVATVELTLIEVQVLDGTTVPAAGGMTAVHVPGHSLGQLAFLWPKHGGVLFAADAAMNMLGLRLMPGHEDVAVSQESVHKLAGLEFEIACFGHGRAIVGGAGERFRRKWGKSGEWRVASGE